MREMWFRSRNGNRVHWAMSRVVASYNLDNHPINCRRCSRLFYHCGRSLSMCWYFVQTSRRIQCQRRKSFILRSTFTTKPIDPSKAQGRDKGYAYYPRIIIKPNQNAYSSWRKRHALSRFIINLHRLYSATKWSLDNFLWKSSEIVCWAVALPISTMKKILLGTNVVIYHVCMP